MGHGVAQVDLIATNEKKTKTETIDNQ